jgi:NhaP-type Na+/H+ and K+/H+ antiporter
VVVIQIAAASHGHTHIWTVVGELAGGIGLGIAMPLVAHLITRIPGIGSEARLAPLGPASVAVILYATCHLTHANAYLAAFAAGSTLATVAPQAHDAFEDFGDLIAELLKLGALLVFGALLTPHLLHRLPIGAWAVAVLALVLVRPLALLVSLYRAQLTHRETAAVAWFGPKGFASVVYGLLALDAGLDVSQPVFDLVAVCIALSIAVHSSTDVPVARMFDVPEALNPPDAPEPSELE